MKNLVLIGFMGSGKTSVGKELARRLECEFVDTDELIEARAGRTIPEIFAQGGESVFRQLEMEAVKEAASKRGVVIATGGGAVLREENVAALRRKGVLVLLDVTPEAAYERVKHETHRPLLQVPDPVARIRELLEARRPYYLQADVVVDTSGRGIEGICETILARFARLEGKS